MNGRRRFERVPFFCDVALTVLPDGPTIAAHSVDISLGGVGMTIPSAVEPGRTVMLAFTLRRTSGGNAVNRVSGRVARCDADSDGNRLGVEFLEPLSESTSPQLVERIMKI
jgi:c-di-GMP-binding flagellar brake protein YcgR